MIKRSLFALALAAALPMSAQAADEGLSFTNVEADYVSSNVLDENFDGFALHGQAAFHENWYATGSWSRVSGDVDVGLPDDVNVDFQESTLGVGFHHAIANNVHFLAEAAWLRYDLNGDGGGDGVDGYRATVGLRALMGPKFEGAVKVNYSDVQDLDDGVGAEIEGVFHINETWGIAAGYRTQDMGNFEDDLNEWKLGVRASF